MSPPSLKRRRRPTRESFRYADLDTAITLSRNKIDDKVGITKTSA
jgi:hypothetical protein